MAMSMVASGKADAYYEVGPHCWDFAAGDLLVREAGGTVIDTSGTVVPYPRQTPYAQLNPIQPVKAQTPKITPSFCNSFSMMTLINIKYLWWAVEWLM